MGAAGWRSENNMNAIAINPFGFAETAALWDVPYEAIDTSHRAPLLPGQFILIDGPGINGMGSNWLQKMQAHSDAGGAFEHVVDADRTLVRPELMWPGRQLEGKRVTLDGSVMED